MTNKDINIGICPECQDYTHFHILKKLKTKYKLMLCDMCRKQVMQYINGSVRYEKVNMNVFKNMDIPFNTNPEEEDY